MGIIARQGFGNSIFIFIGFILGGINTVFIFPYVFKDNLADLGLVQLLITISFICAQVITFGSVGIVIRYYPKAKNENKTGELMFYIWVLPSLALFIFGLILLFFNERFIQLFIVDYVSFDLTSILLILIILTFSISYARVIAGYAAAQKKTVFPSFLNEVLIRIITLAFTALYFFKLIDVKVFGIGNAVAYLIPTLILLFFIKNKELFTIKYPKRDGLKELLEYGFYTWVDSIATWLVNRIDQIMIAGLLLLSDLPVYNFAFFMSLALVLPGRSLIAISSPIIAESYHNNDFDNIQLIYKKSSIVQLLLSGIIFLLIWINIDSILAMEPEPFKEAKSVFLYLGISRLLDNFFSINGTILVTSQYYRYNLLFNMILLVCTIVTNIILIPYFGIVGAAIATAVSLVIFNLLKFIFLYNKYNIHPFHKNTILGLILLAATFSIGYFLPSFSNPWLDMIVRSTITIAFFSSTILYFRVSEDINEMTYKLLNRFFKKR